MPGVFCFGGAVAEPSARAEMTGGPAVGVAVLFGLPVLCDSPSAHPVPFCACRQIKHPSIIPQNQLDYA